MKKITLLFAGIIISLAAFAQTVQRVPLFEIFTSSTCGPCNAGNTNFHNIVASKPVDEFVVVKYQQDFPGTGDPYATAESVNRSITPYNINSIPRMENNGGWDGNASSFTSALYTSAKNAAPLYDISGTYYVDVATKTVTAKVKFKSLGAVVAPKLYVAINENLTTANKKSNGETQFKNVMKKMLPTETGTALTANTNWDSLSFTFQFKGNYRLPANGQPANHINHAIEHSVEGFNDLKVVCWIQGSNKSVYQAYNLVLTTPTGVEDIACITVKDIAAYPNPATDQIYVSFVSEKQENVSFLLVGVDGAAAQSFVQTVNAGNNQVVINTAEVAAGSYFLSVIDAKGNAHTSSIVVVK